MSGQRGVHEFWNCSFLPSPTSLFERVSGCLLVLAPSFIFFLSVSSYLSMNMGLCISVSSAFVVSIGGFLLSFLRSRHYRLRSFTYCDLSVDGGVASFLIFYLDVYSME